MSCSPLRRPDPRHLLKEIYEQVKADGEVRKMGSKSDLLRTLATAEGAESPTPGVLSSDLRHGGGSEIRTATGPADQVSSNETLS